MSNNTTTNNPNWPAGGAMPWPGVTPSPAPASFSFYPTALAVGNPNWPANHTRFGEGATVPASSSTVQYYGLSFVSASVPQNFTASYATLFASSSLSASAYYYNPLISGSKTFDATQSILLSQVSSSVVITLLNTEVKSVTQSMYV